MVVTKIIGDKVVAKKMAAKCSIYKGLPYNGLNQFDTFDQIVKNALARIKKMETKVTYVESLVP